MSKDNALDIRFQRRSSMVTRRVAGEIILVPIVRQVKDDPSLFTLDEVAAFLWDQMETYQSGSELVRKLQTVYDVAPEQAEKDVRQFLKQLQEIEAIEPQAVPA